MMIIIGVLSGFSLTLFLIYKKLNMGLALFTGSVVVALFSAIGLKEFVATVFNSIVSPVALQLMAVVALISGLGYVLKETGDLDEMISALVSLFKDAKLLSMVLPVLIGTLSVPGGAILSAPMVEESGEKINLSNDKKTAVNLFFRHIGYFIYPLFSSIILASELLHVEKTLIIKYNFLIMAAGIVTAYLIFFKGVKSKRHSSIDDQGFWHNLKKFFISFLPILLILILAIVIKIPFYLAVVAGLMVAVFKKTPDKEPGLEYRRRLNGLFKKGIKYELIFVIIGVMAFKSVIEASGAINIIADYLGALGIPLSLMMVLLGLITGYVTGVHVAATGLLVVLFTPMIPVELLGPYISLLFTSIVTGYLLSPLHLCLVLTKEYFKIELLALYKLLAAPIIVMILTGVIQLMIVA